jgi:hypothetical protein
VAVPQTEDYVNSTFGVDNPQCDFLEMDVDVESSSNLQFTIIDDALAME